MKLATLLLIAYLATAYCESRYVMGGQGQSCNEVCYGLEMNCNPVIETNNSTELFAQLGISCQNDSTPANWTYEDHPSYVSDQNSTSYGKCQGYANVPPIQCSGSYPAVQRLCRCDSPSKLPTTFGASYSNGWITTQEKVIFEHFLVPEDVGVLTHFWITYDSSVDNGTIVRYYIDGETTPSIEFTPSLACGVGFYDTSAPWGNEWFGKGSKGAGWYNNFRIPFQKSIKVSVQHLYGKFWKFFISVRGSTNIPIIVGGNKLPRTARMNQFAIKGNFQPLDWVPLVNISSGPGVHWMVTIQTTSGNIKSLEACVHAYFDGQNQFPGVVLSTGTEDYFDSAWNFNAGVFRHPVSGLTYMKINSTTVTWSAYRFHDLDPLFFENGFQLMWRNGDAYDASGTKCNAIEGKLAGDPTPADIIAYGWAYTWSPKDSVWATNGSVMREKYFFLIPVLSLICFWL